MFLIPGLPSNPKLFTDDTSFSPVPCYRYTSANELNNDLLKIRNSTYQWKMQASTQAQEVIFSRNIKKPNHPALTFNNNQRNQTPYYRHLAVFLDDKLNFFVRKQVLSKFIKGTLSGLRQFLATENPLKMMENLFYFFLKALFLLKIFKFLS